MNIKATQKNDTGVSDLLAKAALAADFLRSLAHEHRLAILCLLDTGPMSVGAIAAELGLAQPKVSQHLTRLRTQKLVVAVRSGTSVHYRAVSPTARRIAAALRAEFCPPETEQTLPRKRRRETKAK